MNVIIIMACATIGTITLIFLAGSSRWSLIYLIRYRLLKCEVKNNHYEISTKKDIYAVLFAFMTLIAGALLLIYGIPFVIENFSKLPVLP